MFNECDECGSADDFIDSLARGENPYEEENVLRVERVSDCPAVQEVARAMITLSVHEPRAFTVLCLKILHPEATEEKICSIIKELQNRPDILPGQGHSVYRQKISQWVKLCIDRHPEFRDVFTSLDDTDVRKLKSGRGAVIVCKSRKTK